MPIAVNRFAIVPPDSSAARMPLPGATMALATRFNSAGSIVLSAFELLRALPVYSRSGPETTRYWRPGGALSARPLMAGHARRRLFPRIARLRHLVTEVEQLAHI